jgi:uncharacterized membrane protein
MLFWFDPNDRGTTISLGGTVNTNMTGAMYTASGTLSAAPSNQSSVPLPGPIIVSSISIGGGSSGLGSPKGITRVQGTAADGGLVS